GLFAFTLLVAVLFPKDAFIQVAALSFLTAQLVIGYAVAGIAKAVSGPWWNGSAFVDIVGTVAFGVPALHRMVVRWPLLARAASWCVILWEVSFIVALFGPPGVTVGYLMAGICFHAGVAAIMGFNSFLYFFVAT